MYMYVYICLRIHSPTYILHMNNKDEMVKQTTCSSSRAQSKDRHNFGKKLQPSSS